MRALADVSRKYICSECGEREYLAGGAQSEKNAPKIWSAAGLCTLFEMRSSPLPILLSAARCAIKGQSAKGGAVLLLLSACVACE
jgi:hypothetical protein